MAESLTKLEGEITCSLCLNVFQEPRKLPCDHVYCTNCLERLALFRKNGNIECPECRQVAQVPSGQVTGFPTAFQINRLKDVYVDFTRTLRCPLPSTEETTCPISNQCKDHPKQSLEMYCETCAKLICRDCVLKTKKHKGHQCGYLEEIADRVRGELNSLTEPLKEMEIQAINALEKVKEMQTSIKSQGELLQESIDIAFVEIISKLKQEKAALERDAAEKIREKLRNITQQVENIQTSRSQLQTTLASIETAKKTLPEIELITNQKDIKSSIHKMSGEFNTLNLTPCEAADIGLEISTAEDHGNVWRENSYTFNLADPAKCTVTGPCLSYLETNTPGMAEVNVMDAYGKPCAARQSVSVDLRRVRDNTPVSTQAIDRGAGLHTIAIQTAQRGRYKLSVEVNGSHVAQSPYDIFVTKPPTEIGPLKKRIAGLKSPSGLTWSNDKLIISNHDHDCLTIIDSQGKSEDIQLPASLPTGATYDKDGNLYVCTAQDSKLHKLSKTGQRLKSTITGQFKFPNGMILSKNNELYVCDSNDDRVRIFDTELNYRSSISTKAQCMPLDIDMDEDGRLYVVEHGSQRIEVLDSKGAQMLSIGGRRGSIRQGSTFNLLSTQGGLDRLSKPAGVKVFGAHVYVADWVNNCVFVFTKDGRTVSTFGADVLKQPEGLTIDEDGYVYVAHDRKQVILF